MEWESKKMTIRFMGRASLALVSSVILARVALGQEAPAAAAPAALPILVHTQVTTAPPRQPLTLTATIHSTNGIFQPVLEFRRVGDAQWTRVPLIGSGGDLFAATVPGANLTSDIEYYLEVYDNDGNGPVRAGSPEAPFHVSLAARPTVVVVSPAAQPTDSLRKEGLAPNGRLIGGLISVGVGVVGAGVGAWGFVSRGASVANSNQASPATRQIYQPEISEFTTIGVVGLAVGVVAIGIGAYLIASSSGQPAPARDESAPVTGLSVSPLPGGAMVGWSTSIW